MKKNSRLRKKYEFRQFKRRIWKEVELAQRRGIRFEPYGISAKLETSVSGSSPSAPSSANS
jgi:hypothetical protein